MRRCTVVVALLATASTLVAQAGSSAPADEARFKGFSFAYAEYWTSYYTDNGSFIYDPYISWTQIQAIGFVDMRGPFAIASRQTRLRVEARIGYGGAKDDGTAAGPLPNTDGGASIGLGVSLRLPLGAESKYYLGAGVDASMLFAFGNSGSTYFSDGWTENLITVPLVAGMRLTRNKWVVRPEVRYSLFGTSLTNLEPGSSSTLDENVGPGALAVVVSFSRR